MVVGADFFLPIHTHSFLSHKYRTPLRMCSMHRGFSKKPIIYNSKSIRKPECNDKFLYLQSIGADDTSDRPSIQSASSKRAQGVANYLRRMGLQERDVERVFFMCPEVMGTNHPEELGPVFTFLEREVMVSPEDVSKFISSRPRLLICSVKDHLRPTFYFLKKLGFQDLQLPTCQNSCLLASSVEDKLIPKVLYAQSMGFSYKQAVRFIRRFPAFFGYSIEKNLRPKFEYLKHDMGGRVADLREFPQYFAFSLERKIKPRHEFLRQRGLRLPLSTMLMTDDEHFYILDFSHKPKNLKPN